VKVKVKSARVGVRRLPCKKTLVGTRKAATWFGKEKRASDWSHSVDGA